MRNTVEKRNFVSPNQRKVADITQLLTGIGNIVNNQSLCFSQVLYLTVDIKVRRGHVKTQKKLKEDP